MTSIPSKALPFLVLFIASGFMAVDMFYPQFVISEQMVTLATTILTPLGLGGLINKGWNTYKSIKHEQLELMKSLPKD